jgi:hypothetical protein
MKKKQQPSLYVDIIVYFKGLVHLIRMISIVIPWLKRASSLVAFVDFLSYVAVLVPIVQTKKRLRLAVQIDERGKTVTSPSSYRLIRGYIYW